MARAFHLASMNRGGIMAIITIRRATPANQNISKLSVSGFTAIGLMIVVMPRTKPMLKMFDPIIFPMKFY